MDWLRVIGCPWKDVSSCGTFGESMNLWICGNTAYMDKVSEYKYVMYVRVWCLYVPIWSGVYMWMFWWKIWWCDENMMCCELDCDDLDGVPWWFNGLCDSVIHTCPLSFEDETSFKGGRM